MSNPANTSLHLTAQPVYLAARAVNTLRRALPAGTAYFIGIVLVPLLTGQLVQHQGSLARAALPYVVPLRWGWQRVARALERGQFSLDARFDRALTWCLEGVPVEPVRWGRERRPGPALDSAPVARLRAHKKRCARLGKGYCQRAKRAGPAHRGAARTTVVRSRGVGVGVVGRPRGGAPCAEAVSKVFAALPDRPERRRFSVAAGMARGAQFRAATERAARVGRGRKHVAGRRAPNPRRPGRRGRPALQGPVRHPGAPRPAGPADEDPPRRVEERAGRGRRWRPLPVRAAPQTSIEVVRVEDPADQRPLRLGTPACELTTDESSAA